MGTALSKDSLFDEISLSILLIARIMFFRMECGCLLSRTHKAVCCWALRMARKINVKSRKLTIFLFASIVIFKPLLLNTLQISFLIPLISFGVCWSVFHAPDERGPPGPFETVL